MSLVSVPFHQSCPSFDGIRSIDNTLRHFLLSKEYFLLMGIWCHFFPSWIPFDWQFSRPAPLLLLSGASRPTEAQNEANETNWGTECEFVGLPGRCSLSPRVSPSRAVVLSCAHCFQAAATQATMLPLKFSRGWCFLDFLWQGSLNLS